jgi:hypothetical protein
MTIKHRLLTLIAFLGTLTIHYVWLGIFPETDPAQSQWVLVPVKHSWWDLYLETESYWLGYSYALCVAFIIMASQSYLLTRCMTSGRMVVGGMTLTGGLAVFGCFLIGCCGSPMLIVWINLFGVGIVPLAKPFVALLTTFSIAVAWYWMRYSIKKGNAADISC